MKLFWRKFYFIISCMQMCLKEEEAHWSNKNWQCNEYSVSTHPQKAHIRPDVSLCLDLMKNPFIAYEAESWQQLSWVGLKRTGYRTTAAMQITDINKQQDTGVKEVIFPSREMSRVAWFHLFVPFKLQKEMFSIPFPPKHSFNWQTQNSVASLYCLCFYHSFIRFIRFLLEEHPLCSWCSPNSQYGPALPDSGLQNTDQK